MARLSAAVAGVAASLGAHPAGAALSVALSPRQASEIDATNGDFLADSGMRIHEGRLLIPATAAGRAAAQQLAANLTDDYSRETGLDSTPQTRRVMLQLAVALRTVTRGGQGGLGAADPGWPSEKIKGEVVEVPSRVGGFLRVRDRHSEHPVLVKRDDQVNFLRAVVERGSVVEIEVWRTPRFPTFVRIARANDTRFPRTPTN